MVKRRAYKSRYHIYHARRDEWLAKHGPCAKCNTWEDLQVDHIVPRKFQPATKSATIWRLGAERRARELRLCQVLCNSCHKAKTRNDMKWCEHGYSAYRYLGCRCDICKAGHNERVKAWKARAKANPKYRMNVALSEGKGHLREGPSGSGIAQSVAQGFSGESLPGR